MFQMFRAKAFAELFILVDKTKLDSLTCAVHIHRPWYHYNDVIMSAMASQITCVSIACSTAGSGADKRNHQSSMSLAFVRGIHRGPVNSPHTRPVTRKMFPYDDVILCVPYLWYVGMWPIELQNIKQIFHATVYICMLFIDHVALSYVICIFHYYQDSAGMWIVLSMHRWCPLVAISAGLKVLNVHVNGPIGISYSIIQSMHAIGVLHKGQYHSKHVCEKKWTVNTFRFCCFCIYASVLHPGNSNSII